MQTTHVFRGLVLALLLVSGQVSAAQDLIQTLYHAELDQDEENPVPHFTLDGELGVLVATGNTSAASLKAAVTSEHETLNWSNHYNAEMLYKESDVADSSREVTAQRFFANAQFDYKLKQADRRLFLYGDYEDDRFNGYAYRASLAGGWSQRLWSDENSKFRYSVGPGYSFIEAETNTMSSVNSGFIVRASAEYRYNWSTGAKFRQFVSTEAGTENVKSRSETSLSASIFGSLALKLSLILNHETDAADANASLNTETSVTLVYQFF
ncbi:DUF481 domain-containing protein [Alteromonas halophila]|uniref:DUF481 domain-containing protein n=1 Tax=Alteromonas halophila TaxID=516698 RepID=A0A918N0G8_9ALTE|nr:DUF481 domain-containing protein [Alteromonas halophila]GGW93916.1 hypothetical protein GCM10007391_30270 [Alteromonas halophila]